MIGLGPASANVAVNGEDATGTNAGGSVPTSTQGSSNVQPLAAPKAQSGSDSDATSHTFGDAAGGIAEALTDGSLSDAIGAIFKHPLGDIGKRSAPLDDQEIEG